MKSLFLLFLNILISYGAFATEIYLTTSLDENGKDFIMDETLGMKLYPQTQGDSVLFNQVFFAMRHCYKGNIDEVVNAYKKYYQNDEEMGFLVVKQSNENIMVAMYDNWQYYNEGNSIEPNVNNAFDYIYEVVVLAPCLFGRNGRVIYNH